MLQDVLPKKTLRPAVQRGLAREMETSYRVSERRACKALAFPRSTVRYLSVAEPQEHLRMRLRDLG